MLKKTLYKEVFEDSKIPVNPEEQTQPITYLSGTICVKASEEEIEEAKIYFAKHKKCKIHLIYDEDGFTYTDRYCGICGKWLGFI